jgi:hypothetical protein
MKSERELRKELKQCNKELADIGPLTKQSADTQTILLKKYWTSKRSRVRAYLCGYERDKDAKRRDRAHTIHEVISEPFTLT